MKKIALVGSTGSIGKQVISVVRRNPDKFKIVCIIANRSKDAFLEQLNELTPEYAALTDVSVAKTLTEIPKDTKFFGGEDGAMQAFEGCGADVAFVASSGFSGLKYSLSAVKRGISLALANKETLVCGGDIVMPDLKAPIMPVDSEHSAIWQCLNFNRSAKLHSLVITASGGPFRGKSFGELEGVTPAEALNHPTWKMGPKITVDSATLLNKGYEVIEAHHLYGVSYESIHTVIHPQSIVHSMVNFCDGATLAQLSYPTMELPIALALTYPDRVEGALRQLDFNSALTLEFLPLVRKAYPMYDLALSCGERGGIYPTVLNGAAESAVWAFLQGKIKYTDMYTVTEKVVSRCPGGRAECFENLCEQDALSRKRAEEVIKSLHSPNLN